MYTIFRGEETWLRIDISGVSFTLEAKSDLTFASRWVYILYVTTSGVINLESNKMLLKQGFGACVVWLNVVVFVVYLISLRQHLLMTLLHQQPLTQLILIFKIKNRCTHNPTGHLFWRPQMRCVHTQRHTVLLIMYEWWVRGTRPPRSWSPMSHIYVLPWQLARNKALKQQEAWGISLSQTAQQGMQSPLPRAVDSVRRGREATWSSIMNPQGLVLPLATGAKTVHPGS